MRELTLTERRAALEAELAQFQNLRRKAEDGLIALEKQFQDCASKLVSLRQAHIEECKKSARGEKNQHVEVEADIAASEARRIGLQALLQDQKQKIDQIRKEGEPAEIALQQVIHQETVDRQTREIEQLRATAKNLQLTIWEKQRDFRNCLQRLRSYTEHPLQSIGRNLAAELESAGLGIHVLDHYTADELRTVGQSV